MENIWTEGIVVNDGNGNPIYLDSQALTEVHFTKSMQTMAKALSLSTQRRNSQKSNMLKSTKN